MRIDVAEIQQQIDAGIIRAQSHPTLPLTIYNYTDRCQYDKLWTPLAEQCRGLIMDGETVVARPFRKFFNDTEHDDGEIPWNLPCEITEKLDGSLLILFFYAGEWRTATRGSFVSEQAARGMEILRRTSELDALLPRITYLFEVIYPENRIVVDYGGREECVLLGMVNRKTGIEIPLRNAPQFLRVVRQLDFKDDVRELRQVIRDDEEGYVVRFANGFRMKVKGRRYMELHRAISGLSSRIIWEHLSQSKPLDDLLAMIPDEYGDWVRREVVDQSGKHNRLIQRGWEAANAVAELPTRKEQALAIKSQFPEVSSLAFAMLDGKDASPAAWKMVYPPLRLATGCELLEVAK